MDAEHRAAHILPSVVEVRRRATVTVVALGAVMLARAWSLLAMEWSLVLIGSVPRDGSGAPPDLMARLRAADAMVNASGIAIAIAFVVTAIAFLRWIHRLVALAGELGAQLRWKPADAVWSFLIPFVSLVRPYRVISTTYAALEPELVAPAEVRVDPSAQADYRSVAFVEPSATRKLPAAPIGPWWGAYLVMSVSARFFSSGATPATMDSVTSSYRGNMLACVIALVAAALAIMVVRALTARVVERFRRIRESSPEALDAQDIQLS